MSQDDARKRLGRYVRRRRIDLGLSIDDARAAAGGMSATTWSRVEKGQTVRGLTYGGVDQALKWTSGSSEETLTGGEPTPLEDRDLADPARATDQLTVEREPDIHEIARRLAERVRWIEEDRERDRAEMRRLQEEIERLKGEQSG